MVGMEQNRTRSTNLRHARCALVMQASSRGAVPKIAFSLIVSDRSIQLHARGESLEPATQPHFQHKLVQNSKSWEQHLILMPPPHSGTVSQWRWTSSEVRLSERLPSMIVDTGGLGWALRVMQAIASCCEVRPSKFFGNTPTGCTHRHYIHKTLGSVAPLCTRTGGIRQLCL